MRPIKFNLDFIPSAAGSVLVEIGNTRVICCVSIENKVPPFLKGAGQGWLSAEYEMMPASGHTRKKRSRGSGGPDGRSQEIQRLIGRSLRSAIDLKAIGENTLWVDCDVIQADGGTRTTSINGAMVALVMALRKMRDQGLIETLPILNFIAAMSVGVVDDEIIVDLDYKNDSSAMMDMNLVMTDKGEFIEVQGTAEGKPFTQDQLSSILVQGKAAIDGIISQQKDVLGYTAGE